MLMPAGVSPLFTSSTRSLPSGAGVASRRTMSSSGSPASELRQYAAEANVVGSMASRSNSSVESSNVPAVARRVTRVNGTPPSSAAGVAILSSMRACASLPT